jgi:hypothetical protein
MEEETKDKRSFINAAVMLGTYLICASIPVFYFLGSYPNYDHDRESQITWTLLTFPTLCLGKISTLIMALFAVIGMGLTPSGIGYIIYACFYVILCYGPYILLFWHALKPKNKWLMYFFILWSIANAIGFLYETGYFRKSRADRPRDSLEVRDLKR